MDGCSRFLWILNSQSHTYLTLQAHFSHPPPPTWFAHDHTRWWWWWWRWPARVSWWLVVEQFARFNVCSPCHHQCHWSSICGRVEWAGSSPTCTLPTLTCSPSRIVQVFSRFLVPVKLSPDFFSIQLFIVLLLCCLTVSSPVVDHVVVASEGWILSRSAAY